MVFVGDLQGKPTKFEFCNQDVFRKNRLKLMIISGGRSREFKVFWRVDMENRKGYSEAAAGASLGGGRRRDLET
jgi:hypothetical protein